MPCSLDTSPPSSTRSRHPQGPTMKRFDFITSLEPEKYIIVILTAQTSRRVHAVQEASFATEAKSARLLLPALPWSPL